jgi:uncharacterized membrane protein YhaH (DUF805 family)
MAKTIKKKSVRSAKKALATPFSLYMKKENYLIMAGAAILLIIGYFVMSIDPWNSTPAIVISPIILLFVYIIIVPTAILFTKKNHDGDSKEEESASGKS